jgi:hypothetical protein
MLLSFVFWQSLRKALSEQGASPGEAKPAKAAASYPMAPIGTVQSCFSTRCCPVTQRTRLVGVGDVCLNSEGVWLILQERYTETALGGAAGQSDCGT